MSSDDPRYSAPAPRVSPYPDGVDRDSGLLVFLKVGISPKDHSIDSALNIAAFDDMTRATKAEVVETLEALVRQFRA